MDIKNDLKGEISRRLVWVPVRVLAILTGLFLLRGLGTLFLRYCLSFRRKVTVSMEKGSLVLQEEWWLWGQKIRTATSQTPLDDVRAVRLENRQRYLYLLLGFGSLVVGIWLGIQWFVDGLRAGYPKLALVGAGLIVAGILVDLVLYLFVPRGIGKKVLVLAVGPWLLRVSGVEPDAASRFLEHTRARWQEDAVRGQ